MLNFHINIIIITIQPLGYPQYSYTPILPLLTFIGDIMIFIFKNLDFIFRN